MKYNIFLIKYFRLYIYAAFLLVSSQSFAASHSATVTPIGIGAWTTTSDVPVWNNGDIMMLRLSALYPWSPCSRNVVWFNSENSQGKNILSMLLTAIVTGKLISVSVRDDTPVGTNLCEATAVEILP